MLKRFLLNTSAFFAFVALITLAMSGTIFAQAGTGEISGVVLDSNSAAVSGATVKVLNKANGFTQTKTSGSDGTFSFVLLQPGIYEVTANSSGFAEQKIQVEVNVGRTADAFFTLGVSGVAAVVEVTGEAIQTTQSESDAVINEKAIASLPINGRRFQDFVTLTPTAQVDPQRGQISLSGQRGINSNINVDGVDYNQPFFGGVRGGERSNQAFTIPQESIREFQVVAAGYSAEYGRSSGGIVNAITKSGDNKLRGSAFYFIRPEKLARQNEFVDEIERQRNVNAIAAPTLQQFGGSIGGPIIKDKLFYFGSYEQQRFRAPRRVLFGTLGNIPRDANFTTTTGGVTTINANYNAEAFDLLRNLETEYKQTNDAYAGLGRIDWQMNSQNRLNVRYNYSKNRALNANATGETVLDPTTTRALSNNGTEKNRNSIVVAQFASVLTPNVVNELRFQFAREDRPRFANALAPGVQISGIGEFGTRNFLPTKQFDERTQFINSLTVTKGSHSLKFGGEFSRLFVDQIFGFNQTGRYTIGGSNSAALSLVSFNPGVAGTPTNDRRYDTTAASYFGQIGNLSAAFTVRELSFYAQDSWRVKPSFTLNFGLRAESQYNPSPELGNTALIDLVRNARFPIRGNKGLDPTQIPDSGWQWAPRLGFAWNPSGDGKTVIRGFTGIYYARTPLLLLAAPFNNFRNPAGDLSVRLPFALPSNLSATTDAGQAAYNAFLTANPGYVSILAATGLACPQVTTPTATRACLPNTIYRQFAVIGINLNSVGLGNLPRLSQAQIQQIASLINPGINPLIAGVQPIGMEEDFKNPRSFQAGFGFEREVMKGTVVGLDFSLVNTYKLQRNRDLNLPVPFLRSTTDDPAQRPFFGLSTNQQQRPVSTLGSVQIRESSARSTYRSFTFRVRSVRKWGQLNAYYTLSRSLSDDDNERDAGGIGYDNSFFLKPEFGFSRLDRTHQFVANPVISLPLGVEVSSAIRLRSGLPIDVIANSDLNGDTLFNDRPYLAPGIPIRRNAYRNRPVYDVDLRAQKGFSLSERRRIILSAEFFNVFNLSNIQLSGSTVTAFCAPSNVRCGLDGITNVNFLQVRDQNTTSANFGRLLLNNNPGSQVFQMQLGARFQF